MFWGIRHRFLSQKHANCNEDSEYVSVVAVGCGVAYLAQLAAQYSWSMWHMAVLGLMLRHLP